jgi:hypothetical protein
MKYVYKGVYREFRGYVFSQGRPVEITDPGTLEVISREPDFIPYKETKDEEAKQEAPKEVLKGKECPKCHKLIPRGWYMHQKWCKVSS